jgi:hypothetical protein
VVKKKKKGKIQPGAGKLYAYTAENVAFFFCITLLKIKDAESHLVLV